MPEAPFIVQLVAQFKPIFESSSDIVILSDQEGKVVYSNARAKKYLGYSPEELAGKDASSLFQSTSAADQVADLLNKTGAYSGEVVNLKKDGSPIHCQLNASVIYDKTQQPLGSIGFSRPISIDLAQSNDLLEVINLADDFMYRTSPDGLCTYVNDAILKATGFDLDEFIGKRFTNFINRNDLAESEAFFRNFFQEKEKKAYHEFRLNTSSGDTIWVGQQVITLFSKENPNRIEGYFGIMRNLEAQKRAEQQAREKEKRYKDLFQTSNDLIQIMNAEGVIEVANDSWFNTLGYDRSSLGKVNILDIIHPDSQEHCANLLQSITQSGEAPKGKVAYSLVTKDGKKIDVESTVSLKFNGQKLESIETILRDVTEERRAQEEATIRHNELIQSVRYTKRIQDAVVPTETHVQSIFPESFVIYKAKDIVSGDFYLSDIIYTNNREPLPSLLVADCTGHGVPGGALSLLCAGLVRESYTQKDINSPADAFDYVRTKLTSIFKADSTKQIADGMDAAFVVFNYVTNELYFAGANANLTIIRKGQSIVYKGDKQPIGVVDNPKPFSLHKISVQNDDLIVLFSDGFPDQFGGPRNKKFMRKRLIQILETNSQNSMDELKSILIDHLEEWMHDYEQTDDITLAAVRYKSNNRQQH